MEIFDPLRKKNVKLTAEEQVRQSVISFLHNEMEVPMGLMMSEYSFKFNGLQYRTDIIVFDRKAQPLMFVECKKPSIKLNQSVIDQIIRYNLQLKSKYILITNGVSTYICELNKDIGEYRFLETCPKYSQMTQI